MVLTWPLTFGSQDVIVYFPVAAKLKMLFLVYTTPAWLIWVNRPTAYMVPPHCTSCRITSSVVPVLLSCGVPRAASADTPPDATRLARRPALPAAARALPATGAAPAGTA